METIKIYTIEIADYEPNNIYPNTKESVTVKCKELNFKKSFDFKSGHRQERREFVLSEIRKISELILGGVDSNHYLPA